MNHIGHFVHLSVIIADMWWIKTLLPIWVEHLRSADAHHTVSRRHTQSHVDQRQLLRVGKIRLHGRPRHVLSKNSGVVLHAHASWSSGVYHLQFGMSHRCIQLYSPHSYGKQQHHSAALTILRASAMLKHVIDITRW